MQFCPHFQETKASGNTFTNVTSLFPFWPSSPSVAARLSSGMSPTFTRPAVGPLEVKLTLLDRPGNLTPNTKYSGKKNRVVFQGYSMLPLTPAK